MTLPRTGGVGEDHTVVVLQQKFNPAETPPGSASFGAGTV